MAKGYCVFSNGIYPRRLYVAVMESFMDVLGIERAERGTNEHLSYLLGWIVKCMDEVKKGRVKPVNPVVKNKKNINNKRKDKK